MPVEASMRGKREPPRSRHDPDAENTNEKPDGCDDARKKKGCGARRGGCRRKDDLHVLTRGRGIYISKHEDGCGLLYSKNLPYSNYHSNIRGMAEISCPIVPVTSE